MQEKKNEFHGSKHSTLPNNSTTKQAAKKANFQLKDNRPESIAQRNMQTQVSNSATVKQLLAYQNIADNYLLHQQSETSKNKVSLIQKKKNKNGLPIQLQRGIENLSGYAMDDVKVHYNSSKPAQLKAHAYAQGSNIYLASGQEKHLAHEAWHVVQQKQGKVTPNTVVNGMNVNDSPRLEQEATLMGNKARTVQRKEAGLQTKKNASTTASGKAVIQRERYRNTDNQRVYAATRNIGDTEGSITLRQEGGESHGNISFQFNGRNEATLVHLASHSPAGSGLGSLLVFLFAQEVASRDIPEILVSTPAASANGFYERMGFDLEAAQAPIREMFRTAGREAEIPDPLAVPVLRAPTPAVLANSSQSMSRHWGVPIAPAPQAKKSFFSKLFGKKD